MVGNVIETLQVENENTDSISTKNDSHKYNVSTNYTDWDPSYNNGHTVDDKLIDNFSENPITTTNTGHKDWNLIKADDSWGWLMVFYVGLIRKTCCLIII